MIRFTVHGHKNTRSEHRNTIEFTKDDALSLNGDCILGIRADYGLKELSDHIRDKDHITVTIFAKGISDSFTAEVNHAFDDEHEIVLRRSSFLSSRTLGTRATKAACDIDRRIVEHLKDPAASATIEIR